MKLSLKVSKEEEEARNKTSVKLYILGYFCQYRTVSKTNVDTCIFMYFRLISLWQHYVAAYRLGKVTMIFLLFFVE